MKGYILGICLDFVCIAGDCPSTCCSGWKIIVDEASFRRYQNISDETLRIDILKNIREKDGEYQFRHGYGGRCAMLDTDGLCRIQRNLEETALCNTCRKYPRLSTFIDEKTWISMAASCPVVADDILTKNVIWYGLGEDGCLQPVLPIEFSILQEGRKLLQEEQEKARKNYKEIGSREEWEQAQFSAFTEVSLEILDVVAEYNECTYLEGSFELYEKELDFREASIGFGEEIEEMWKRIFQQYVDYRYPSRYLEKRQESAIERFRQVFGELLLMKVIATSRYKVNGVLQRRDWTEIMTWTYRICAHGNTASAKIHRIFLNWDDCVFLFGVPI